MVVQEQQRQRDLAEQERQQEPERPQQALQEQQAPRFIDRNPSHPGALGPGEWAPHGYRETRLTDPMYREQLRHQREAQQRQQEAERQQQLAEQDPELAELLRRQEKVVDAINPGGRTGQYAHYRNTPLIKPVGQMYVWSDF